MLLIDALQPELPKVEPAAVKREMTVEEKLARQEAANRRLRHRKDATSTGVTSRA